MLAPPPSSRPRSRSTSAYAASRDADIAPPNPFLVNTNAFTSPSPCTPMPTVTSNVSANTNVHAPSTIEYVSTPAGPVPFTTQKVPAVSSTQAVKSEWVPFSVAVEAMGITAPPPQPLNNKEDASVRPRSSSHGSPAKPSGSFNPFKKALKLEDEPDETTPLGGQANFQWAADDDKSSCFMGTDFGVGDASPTSARDDIAILTTSDGENL